MPATFSTLRIGELLRVTASVFDSEGNPGTLAFPTFSETGSIFAIISGENSFQCLISGAASGTDVLGFDGENGFFNTIDTTAQVTVLGGSRWQYLTSGAQNCSVVDRGGDAGFVIRLHDELQGDPTFFLQIIARDGRFGEGAPGGRSEPAYALSDGPNLFTTNGRLRFYDRDTETWLATSEDDADVKVRAILAGEDTIHAYGVAVGTGFLISGELPVLIVTATSVSLSAEAV